MAATELLMATPGARRVTVHRVPLRVTPTQLHEIVLAAWHGTGPCLEAAINRALWGNQKPPERWGDWPRGAVETFDAAVALYNTVARAMAAEAGEDLDVGRPAAPTAPEAADVWQAVRSLVPPDRWPFSPYLTWAEVARVLRCPPSVAHYHLDRMGWAWRGRYDSRRVARAPCMRCGTVCSAGEINPRTGLGSCCAGSRRRRA